MSIKLVSLRPVEAPITRISARLQETAKGEWWSSMSEKQQELYLKQHPASKKAKEIRQAKQGKQPGHDPEQREDRMFGEHDEEHQAPKKEQKPVLIDKNPKNKTLNIPQPDAPADTEAKEPKKGLVDVNPENKELVVPPINSPEAEDKDGTKKPAGEQPDAKQAQQPQEPEADPSQFIDEYSDQITKDIDHKVAKEFKKKMNEAKGPDVEHYKQMEGIWNKTRAFEENGFEPEEFTKDALTFRGKPKDHHAMIRELKQTGEGTLKVDDHGNITGDLEIDGQKVKVTMQKIGRDGEAMISFHPLIDSKKKPKDKQENDPTKPALTQPPVNQPKENKLLTRTKHLLHSLAPVDKEFFEKEEYKPRSKTRRTMGKFFKDKTAGIIKHLHHQGKEWHTAMKAVQKIAGKKDLTTHDKDALMSVAKDMVYTLISVSIAGGLGHGVVGLLHHIGADIVRDSMIKAAAHAALHAHLLQASGKEDEFLTKVIENISNYIETGEITDETWEAVIEDLSKNQGNSNPSDQAVEPDDTGMKAEGEPAENKQ